MALISVWHAARTSRLCDDALLDNDLPLSAMRVSLADLTSKGAYVTQFHTDLFVKYSNSALVSAFSRRSHVNNELAAISGEKQRKHCT